MAWRPPFTPKIWRKLYTSVTVYEQALSGMYLNTNGHNSLAMSKISLVKIYGHVQNN